jgi:hypothetical protein
MQQNAALTCLDGAPATMAEHAGILLASRWFDLEAYSIRSPINTDQTYFVVQGLSCVCRKALAAYVISILVQ